MMNKTKQWMLTVGRACSCSAKRASSLGSRSIAVLAAILTICGASLFTACTNQDNAAGQESQPARIGIAWRCDSTSLTYVSTVRSVREAGAVPVPLPQLKSPVMAYDGDQLLPEYTDSHGILLQEYADKLKADPLRYFRALTK